MAQLQKKVSKLKNLATRQEVWRKEGSALVENVTQTLICETPERISVGPRNPVSGGRQFSQPYDLPLNEMTDQLAIEWLDANDTKTIANVALTGGGEKSGLAKL